MEEVSLYNVRYEKIFDIDWRKAILLLLNWKVISCTEEEFIDIRTGSGVFKLPKHIVLKKYILHQNFLFKNSIPVTHAIKHRRANLIPDCVSIYFFIFKYSNSISL